MIVIHNMFSPLIHKILITRCDEQVSFTAYIQVANLPKAFTSLVSRRYVINTYTTSIRNRVERCNESKSAPEKDRSKCNVT